MGIITSANKAAGARARARASNTAIGIFCTESAPPAVRWLRIITHIHDMEVVNVARWSVANNVYDPL